MQRLLFLLAFLILSLGVTACGGGGTQSEPTPPAAPVPSPQLTWDQGNWNDKNWQ